jgi:hypothetical protein
MKTYSCSTHCCHGTSGSTITDNNKETTTMTATPTKYKSIQVPEGSPAPSLAKELAQRLEQRSVIPCPVAMYQAVETALRVCVSMEDQDLDDYLKEDSK